MDVGMAVDEVATYSGEGRSKRPLTANVVVINTARSLAADLTSGGPCMFVVDECHRAGSDQNAKALNVAAEYRLGLSATPTREFDDGFSIHIAPVLGPIIYEYGHVQARADGLIPAIDLHNFHFTLTPYEQKEYDALTSRIARRWAAAGDPHNDPMVKRLLLRRSAVSITSQRRVVSAVAIAERFDGRGLVFHERIEAADTIARLLDRRGRRVAVYHSGLAAEIRRRNLELFRFGQVQTLVTCRSLDEGLNVPDASVAVMAASTRSTRQRIQRLGRVLRVTDDKPSATVATLYATQPERDQLNAEADRLEDIASVRWYEVRL
jgi:superfamily II DNA or RNA helicase